MPDTFLKTTLFVLLFILTSCWDSVDQQEAPNEKEPSEKPIKQPKTRESTPLKLKRYVNTTTRLNYRDKPNGKVIGKFQPNDEVYIIDKTRVFTEVKIKNKLVEGEWVAISVGADTVYVFDAFLSEYKNKKKTVWAKFPIRKMPFIDSTGFDNIKEKPLLTKQDMEELELAKLYPDLEKEDYRIRPSYQLNLGDFKSVVINVFKGDSELETMLVIYDKNDQLMEMHTDDGLKTNAVLIAYDEIAEGWSRMKGEIKDSRITTFDALYTDTPTFDTTLYHVNRFGGINKVNTDFENNIRPGKKIWLNKNYTDTIKFISYNEEGDYFFLEGEKNNQPVSLIYDWDTTKEKYNFKEGDMIEIKWEMGEISIAGEGETLEYTELAIDAKKL